MKHKIGIIGHGFVGMAVETGLQSVADVRIYDKYKDTESLYAVVNNSDVLFVAVPTPMEPDGWCDTSIVISACQEIDKNAETRKSIVIKSTVPPGTTQGISTLLEGRHGLMFNPEFLTEANFLEDFLNQDRILIGSAKECTNLDVVKVIDLYESFTKTQKEPAFLGEMGSCEAAEMVKYVTNSFLATKVTFFNEIYDICKAFGIDFEEVTETTLYDKRIGKSHASVPGPDGMRGFGGKCFPKDVQALIAMCQHDDVDVMLLESIWLKNSLVREKQDWYDIKGATTDYGYDTSEE